MPRPMSNDVHVERSPRRIRTMFGGETIADSTRAVLVVCLKNDFTLPDLL